MGMRAERTPQGRSARGGPGGPAQAEADLKKLWPQIRALVAPRMGLLFAGLGLMVINRVAGLVLPYTSKPLLDKVLSPLHPHPDLLPRIIALVFSAMVVQAITSFSLTQLLSKAGQRLIAEMRRQVQRHVGLLSVAYYDENRTGTLVARIMTRCGRRAQPCGHRAGRVCGRPAHCRAGVSLSDASQCHGHADRLRRGGRVRVRSAICLQDDSPHLPRAGQDQRRGHGPADRVAGRCARDQGLPRRGPRGHGVFAEGVERLLTNVMKSLTMTSVLGSASTTVLGLVSALVMWLGGHQRAESHLDGRRLLQLQHVSRFHDRAGLPDREHRHAIDRSICRPRPHE